MTKLVKSLAFAGMSIASILTLSLGTGVAQPPLLGPRSGQLHLVKDCTPWFASSGATPYCQIVASNLEETIPSAPVGMPYNPLGDLKAAIVGYDQPANNFNLNTTDSNVVLYIPAPGALSGSPGTPSSGNWAVGRCTLNPDGNSGLCTFSDGVGTLYGFTARLTVTHLVGTPQFRLDGTYRFTPLFQE